MKLGKERNNAKGVKSEEILQLPQKSHRNRD